MHRLVSTMASGFAVILLLAPSSAACRQIEAQDIKRVERSLASFAAETGLLLEQAQRGRLTDTYAHVHLRKLKEALGDIRHDLDGSSVPAIQSRRDRVLRLAEIFDADLSMLAARMCMTRRRSVGFSRMWCGYMPN